MDLSWGKVPTAISAFLTAIRAHNQSFLGYVLITSFDWTDSQDLIRQQTINSLTSFFSLLEKRKSLLFCHNIETNEIIPFPMRSTPKEVSQGYQDRTPYFLISTTYIRGLKINITSPVRNKPPGIPFSDKKVERLGISATGAVKIQETCLVEKLYTYRA